MGDAMKRRPSAKWLAVIGVVGVVAVGTTLGLVDAAGASSGAPAPRVAASGPATTVAFTFKVSVTGLTASAVTVTGSGQADLADHAASLAVDLPAAVAKLIPGGSASPETIDAVLSGSTVYVEIPSLASTLGEPWISIGLPSKAASALPGAFTKVASALGNVNSILAFARAHQVTVTSLGSATVDGVQATGSKIVATISKKHGAHTITGDVWADTSGRLVQSHGDRVGGRSPRECRSDGHGRCDRVRGTGDITVPQPSEVKAIPLAAIEMLLGNHGGSQAGHGSSGGQRLGRARLGRPRSDRAPLDGAPSSGLKRQAVS